jgi:hypothetical protein
VQEIAGFFCMPQRGLQATSVPADFYLFFGSDAISCSTNEKRQAGFFNFESGGY